MTARKVETVTAPVLREPAPPSAKPVNPEDYALETLFRSLIHLGAITEARSLQRGIGISSLGAMCERQITYAMTGTQPVHFNDPLRALFGTGWHLVMKEMFGRLDAGRGRFLIEKPQRFRGIPGTPDLLDRYTHTLVDWKTTLKSKLNRIRNDGPPTGYVVQLQGYAAALISAGETVKRCALIYVPVDGELDDIYAWSTLVQPDIANAAVERINALQDRQPVDTPMSPSALCGWCDYHNPNSTDIRTSCPGGTAQPTGEPS